MQRLFLGWLTAAVLLLSAAGAVAQQTTGTIIGFVRDTSGGALPGVTVVALQASTGFTREAATDERGAYVLMDRATVLTLRKEIRLQILVENDPDLLNYIAILVNPARLPKVNAADARRFGDWLVAEDAQRLVKDFGVERHGAPLFFPNAEEWRRKHPR